VETNKIEINILSLSILAVVSVELATALVLAQNLYRPLFLMGGARFLEVILIVLVVSIWGCGLESIGLAQAKIVPGLKRGLIWSAAFAVISSLAFAALFLAGIDPLKLLQTRLPTKPGTLTLFFLVGGIVGPIAEEVFFRGVLYGFFRRWGFAVALVLSTLIFLLSHGMVHGVPITQAVGGILFAVAYEVESILIVPITIHCLGNLAIFVLSWLL
jgi:membrane protease YdiL (CAAX protease family)